MGASTRDDAAVYRLDADRALVVTTDFFTPVVDDPRDFGRIAAANALSDVYAMGGRPILALNLVGFPARELPLEILGEIMEGGAEKVLEAGALLAGGHSIDDREPKYGLCVVGLVHPDRVMSNAGARPGDLLLLTKPLGSGVVTTAIKRGLTSPAEVAEVTGLMATLNRVAGEVLIANPGGVHALTDVTGYGLLGHLLEVLEASGVGARLDGDSIPVLESARRFAAAGAIPGGSRANLEAFGDQVDFTGAWATDEVRQLLLADAQTSGGLLASVDPAAADALVAAMTDAGCGGVRVIGEITSVEGLGGPVRVLVEGR